MNARRTTALISFAGIALLAACGGGGGAPGPVSCGAPSPQPPPQLYLVYPMPSATAVPDALGQVVFASLGATSTNSSVTISSGVTQVPVGAYTTAPSPLPLPHVTPGTNFGGNVPYIAVPVPTLSPATSYTVTFSYQDWADKPPSCTATYTQTLGTFTTQ